MEKTLRIGTLVYMKIFCRTFSSPDCLPGSDDVGHDAISISRLMPSWAALDFCSPSVPGSRT